MYLCTSIMPLDVLGRACATLIEPASLSLPEGATYSYNNNTIILLTVLAWLCHASTIPIQIIK